MADNDPESVASTSKIRRAQAPNKEATANIFSRLSFGYVSPLLALGSKRPLEHEDLYVLEEEDTTDDSVRRFNAIWTANRAAGNTSLTSAMKTMAGAKVTVGVIACLLSAFMPFSGPILLQLIIAWLDDKKAPLWHGLLYAGLMVILPFFGSVLSSFMYRMFGRIGVQWRAALNSLIFTKSLKLTNESRSTVDQGKIVQYMSTDTEAIFNFTFQLVSVVSAPIQIVFALGYLSTLLKWAVFGAVLAAILFIPYNAIVAVKTMKANKQKLVISDKRVAMMTELLSGIKVIKFNAYEDSFLERIIAKRAEELALIASMARLEGLLRVGIIAAPTLIYLGAILLYAAIYEAPSTEIVFVSYSLFGLLRMPLATLPSVAIAYIHAKQSAKRIEGFLLLEELPADASVVKPLLKGEPVAEIVDGVFKWAAPPPTEDADKDKANATDGDGDGDGDAKAAAEAGAAAASSAGPAPKSGKGSVKRSGVGSKKTGGGADEEEQAEEEEESWSSSNSSSSSYSSGTSGYYSDDSGDSYSVISEQEEEEEKGAAVEMKAVASGSASTKAKAKSKDKGKGKGKSSGSAKKEKGSADDTPATTTGEVAADADAGGDGREYTLRGINMRVNAGELVMVVGPVGSGKSSLLAALLGEIEAVKGTAVLRGNVAYVPQTAWIVNKTLKENVYLGNEYDPVRYATVLEACALTSDIAVLPAGDETEIGERGINLSGGQKQRVSLARAVYADADTYIIDDPLSAVDAHVGKHLFKEVINGVLRGKTRVMTTNQLQYLPAADNVVVLDEDGSLAEVGTFSELMARDGAFAAMYRSHMGENDSEDSDADETSAAGAGGGAEAGDKAAGDAAVADPDGKLMTVEERETGAVNSRMYFIYFAALGGWCYLGGWALLHVVSQLTDNGTNAWLALWVDDALDQSLGYYTGWLAVIVVASALGILIREFYFVNGRIRASQNIHDEVLHAVVRSPMSFFDTTPQGRILNRFSKDISQLDSGLPSILAALFMITIMMIGLIVTVMIITPYYIIAIAVVAPFYWKVAKYYRTSGVEIKRLDSIARSPIYNHFGECLNGVDSIRAYKIEEDLKLDLHNRIDASSETFNAMLFSRFWLSIRLGFVGVVLMICCSLAIVLTKGTLSTGFAALAISYAMSTQIFLEYFLALVSQAETMLNCVERLDTYTKLEPEAPNVIEGSRPPGEWPTKGEIAFKDVSMRYREGLPLVLKNLNASIKGGEKVGVVGRTGSGKSSLMLLLFRLIEAAEGRITIDGLDISGIGLRDLRKQLAIIPQDPVLFNGSLRENLDPFFEYSNDDLEEVIDMALLRNVVNDLEGGLEGTIAESGSNLSVGQRQLVCLGRALLKKPKILVLDEATASVDFDTDVAIQRTVRTAFKHATTLTIAHRLNTIVDSDRVMVLDDGSLVEFDTPSALLKNEDGIFFHLVHETGANSAKHLTDIAVGKKSYLDMLASDSMVIEELQRSSAKSTRTRTASGVSREASGISPAAASPFAGGYTEFPVVRAPLASAADIVELAEAVSQDESSDAFSDSTEVSVEDVKPTTTTAHGRSDSPRTRPTVVTRRPSRSSSSDFSHTSDA